MEGNFKLSVDTKTGAPYIKIRHHDRSLELEHTLLGLFIQKAKTNGIELFPEGGFLDMSGGRSWEDYKIRCCKEQKIIYMILYCEGDKAGKVWGSSLKKETLLKRFAEETIKENDYFKDYSDDAIWVTVESSGEFEIKTSNYY